MGRKGIKGSWSLFMGFVLTASVALTGCGGGGGGGGTTTTTTDTTTDSGGSGASLRVAERISVVDASSSGSGVAGLRIGKFRVPTTVSAAGTDWTNDVTQTFVHERSAEAFGVINEILCMMSQSQYDDMVNKGTYRAQIDTNQCEQERDSAESAGESSQNQSSSTTMPDYEDWTVNSYRANDTSDHIVKVWIHEEARSEGSWSEPAKTIYVKVTITEGASAANPYGLFRLDFKGIPDGSSTVMFKGYLESVQEGSSILLKFVDEGAGGSDTWTEQVVLNRSADGSTGTGTIYTSNSGGWGSETSDFDIAFNSDYFLRDNGTEQKCADRNDFNETAWRYGLYDVNGARVNRESGFPIKYGDYHGWVGYWGLWLPEEANVSDGATVYKQVYSSNAPPTETAYTLMQRGGKLKKHTRNAKTLGDIQNLPLDWWECNESGCSGYRVKWNGTNFVKFANQVNNMWNDDFIDENINLSTLQFGELNFYSQSLGGQVRVKLIGTGTYPSITYSYPDPTAPESVIFFKEDIVYPGDTTVPATLKCYDNCPEYNSTVGGINVDNWYNGNHANNYDPSANTSYSYTFNATTASGEMTLKEGVNALLLPSNSTSQWGYWSGPLFDPTPANLTALACDDWNGDIIANEGTCGWKAWSELTVFYTWETGTQQWNQFTALINGSGTVEQFQAPLQVSYEYQKTNNAYADGKYCLDGAATCETGTNFYLEYSGFGNLWGIPGTCVDDSGNPTTCGEGTRWISEFMIPAGAAVANNGTTYYVKPLEVEQTMKLVSAATCTTAGLATTPYTLPSITNWSDPAIGTEPTTAAAGLISEAPAVIGGVVQSGF